MKDELSIKQEVFNHPVMDYVSLRQEGIRQLQRLTDSEWTDFNEHDPGITILEQLCYALSDLAYRIDFSLPDLLSENGANPYASLHAPALILSSRPVTLIDMRKLVIDVEGVKNAWIEKVENAEPVVYFQKQGLPRTDQPANLGDAEKLIFFANERNIANIKTDAGIAIQTQGLFRVLIEKYPNANPDIVEEKVTARLQAHRSLAMDFQAIKVLEPQPIPIKASIEITQHGNPDDIYAAILQKIADYFSPSVTFYSLAERLATNLGMEEIFDGPRLDHGFIDTAQLANMKRKTSLRTSDLIHTIMDVEGVRMIKNLVFMNQNKEVLWVLDLEDNKVPVLDPVLYSKDTSLTLERNQLTVKVDVANLPFKQTVKRTIPVSALEPTLPSGRNRQVGGYHSIQHQFPANYGVGAVGLPATANEKRQAQARQIKAYLLFFDQIMANSFNQLAHLKDLFGFDDALLSTYFMDFIDDESLRLEALWVTKDAQKRENRLQEQLENLKSDNDLRRKNRFLDHLLARFADSYTDYSRFQKNELFSLDELARDKAAILRHYPEISGGRGTACNVTKIADKNACTGLEQRLRLKLGIVEPEQLYLLEHILLRPTDSDKNQTAPLLADARFDDPYSLQISLVFSGNSSRFKDLGFRKFVAQTVREETPAHLFVHLRDEHWLVNEPAISNFKQAYENWKIQQSNYRNKPDQTDLQLRFRDARDSMIDLLEIGHSYPLADLPVSENVTVAFGERADIVISYYQKGVTYQLYDKNNNPIAATTEEKGEELTLITNDAIVDNRTFFIQATKSHGEKALSVMLIHSVTVKVGLNRKLVAKIIINEEQLDTALVDYGVTVQVKMPESQQGVEYSLVDKTTGETISKANENGKGREPISLFIANVHEDVQIKIHAKNPKKDETALLDVELSLMVRANPALAFTITPAILDYRTGTTVVINNSQASASYQIFTRPILDSEFIRIFATDKADWTLDMEAMSAYWMKNPPTGLSSLGEPKTGTGGDLVLPVTTLTEDSVMVIRATKTVNKSSIQLTQMTALLVRPGAKSDFHLYLKAKEDGVSADGLKKDVVYIVQNGQPGVFYHFRLAGSTEDLSLPVYFHKKDKGINQLQIEIDFVMTDSLPTPPPEWNSPVDLNATAILSIRAVKAQTGVETIFQTTVAELLKQPDTPA